jgi:hypothetical protein
MIDLLVLHIRSRPNPSFVTGPPLHKVPGSQHISLRLRHRTASLRFQAANIPGPTHCTKCRDLGPDFILCVWASTGRCSGTAYGRLQWLPETPHLARQQSVKLGSCIRHVTFRHVALPPSNKRVLPELTYTTSRLGDSSPASHQGPDLLRP